MIDVSWRCQHELNLPGGEQRGNNGAAIGQQDYFPGKPEAGTNSSFTDEALASNAMPARPPMPSLPNRRDSATQPCIPSCRTANPTGLVPIANFA